MTSKVGSQTVPAGATIGGVVIDGVALERARKRMGYRSQEEAARAMGVSLRKFGDLERNGVPAKYEAAARRAFWPGVAAEDVAVSLASFDDMELLAEIGRRFALYKREAAERAGEEPTPEGEPGSGFGQEASEVRERTVHGPTVPEPPRGGAIRGRMGVPPRTAD